MNELADIKDEIVSLWRSGEFENKSALARHINLTYGTFTSSKDNDRRGITRIINNSEADKDVIESNVKLAKQKQKQQDVNRIERKSFREYARIENSVSEYGSALVNQMELYGSKLAKKINIVPVRTIKNKNKCGIIQITDLHANELINLPHNQYNFDVLRVRLKKLIDDSCKYFDFKGVNKVLMAFTGDLLNSDRRLDELLNQSVNRSKASVLTAHLIIQAVLDVRNRGFVVDIVSVLGNESRVNKEMTFSNEAFSDNYDYTIMAMVQIAIESMNIEGIRFLSIDKMEAVIDFGKQKWLFMHDISKITDTQAKTQSAMGRYLGQGIKIDYMIGGHIHAFRGTDLSTRSGSMAGSNSYNEHALNLLGRASGICYVVNGLERSLQYIDLQFADNEGYEIESKLESYYSKSDSKIREETTVFKIVI